MTAETVTGTRRPPAAPLRGNRRFQAFWAGQTISQFGDRITGLALPLIAVTMLAATPGQVSLLTALIWLPHLFGIFVGAWVDRRTHKRRLLVTADLIQAAALLSLPVGYLFDAVTLTQLYVVALLAGTGALLFSMAYQAFFVTLVPPAAYLDANSRLSLSRAGASVAGPAAGGALVQALTAPVAILADAVSFLASALVIGRIPVTEVPPPRHGSSALALIRHGFALVLRHPVLRACLGCTSTVNFFTMISSALLVLYANRELGLPAGAIGLALGIGAGGAVVGAAVALRVARWLGVGRTAILGALLFPGPLALMALATGPTWAKVSLLAGAGLVSGVGVMLMDINLNALITVVTPDEARGRRAGAYSTINYGIRPIGALVGGGLGATVGLRPAMVVAGVGGMLAALWLLASPVRRIATIGDPVEATSGHGGQ